LGAGGGVGRDGGRWFVGWAKARATRRNSPRAHRSAVPTILDRTIFEMVGTVLRRACWKLVRVDRTFAHPTVRGIFLHLHPGTSSERNTDSAFGSSAPPP